MAAVISTIMTAIIYSLLLRMQTGGPIKLRLQEQEYEMSNTFGLKIFHRI